MDSKTSSPLRLPSLKDLPGKGATLKELIRFACSVDPTAHFQARGGKEYQTSVQALWHRCVQDYKQRIPAAGAVDELLMCLAYDVVLGP